MPGNAEEARQKAVFNARLKDWMGKLLDLSDRNTQIKFRPGAKSLVEIIHPEAATLFKVTVIDGKEVEFIPVYDPGEEKADDEEEPAATLDDEGDPEEDNARLHEAAITAAIRNAKTTQLVTRKDDPECNRSLRGLMQRTKLALEEKGVNILYLTFGLLSWYNIRETVPHHSPILFVPVKIGRNSVMENYTVELLDDDVVVNIALREKLKTVFNITLPDFPEEFDEDSMTGYFSDLEALLARGNDTRWLVEPRIFLATFSFSKIPLHADLAKHSSKFYDHQIVRAIGIGGGYRPTRDQIPGEEEMDDRAHPQDTFTILDSDSSQFAAIQYARKGCSLVIRGPPGTGKSQSIANIIAECLGAGKRVLFVAQKRAALDVVKKRLDDKRLGVFCLELHSQKANKKDVIETVSKNLNIHLEVTRFDNSNYDRLMSFREKLNRYITEMNNPRGRSSKSLYRQIGEVMRYKTIPAVDASIPDPTNLSESDLVRIQDTINGLERNRHVLENYGRHPWFESAIREPRPGLKDHLLRELPPIIQKNKQLITMINWVNASYPIKPITTAGAIKKYESFFAAYNEKALRLDARNYIQRFQERYANFMRFLKPSFYKDRAAVQGCFAGLRLNAVILEELSRIDRFQKEMLAGDTNGTDFQDMPGKIAEITRMSQEIEARARAMEYLRLDAPDGVEKPWEWRAQRLYYWNENVDRLDEWMDVHETAMEMERLGCGNFFKKIQNNDFAGVEYSKLFRKNYLQEWINKASQAVPEFRNFFLKNQEDTIQEFRELDKKCTSYNSARLAKKITGAFPAGDDVFGDAKSSERGILERESLKKRNVKPLREILTGTKNLITTLKPCFMMSPLSVASYLPLDVYENFFDVVIFDEASQVCPEDAVGAILRGKQLVVVGDEKQLPPTSFFQVENIHEDEELENIEPLESILDECKSAGLKQLQLNWHYRSRKEGLIHYSNYHFYDNNLQTFPDLLKDPSASKDVETLPAIEYVQVLGGVYDRGKSRKNHMEAEAVVDRIIEHFKRNKLHGKRFSLGVVALSQAQEEAIDSALQARYRVDPGLEKLVNSIDNEPFFIKNLENVQGDERDFVFLSIGYGKDKDGKMTLSFGPLNRTGGERRLNVAITRSRHHMKVFCSFNPSEIPLSQSNALGLHKLIMYLKYARDGDVSDPMQVQATHVLEHDSPFEEEVCKALEEMGYAVDAQVGCSGYRIDLAIVNPREPSKYILGIECDGASYHSAKTARDRDRLRHEILEGLGWRLFHIWSPDWYKDRNAVLARIKATVDKTEQSSVREQAVAAKPAAHIQVKFNEQKAQKPSGTNGVDMKDKRVRKKLIGKDGVVQYVKYTGHGDQRSFYDSPRYVANFVSEIIDAEGPIHEDLLAKRILECFGFKRAGGRIQQTIDAAIRGLRRVDHFYMPATDIGNTIRICVDPDEDPRSFDQISLQELKNCLMLVITRAMSISREDLFSKVVQIFGFSMKTQDVLARLETALKKMAKEGSITTSTEGKIEVVRDNGQ